MSANYNYNEYLEIKSKNIERFINESLNSLNDSCQKDEVVADALAEYEILLNEIIKRLYSSVNLYPEEYQFESFIYKVENPTIRSQIAKYIDDLILLMGVINSITDGYCDEREPKTIEDVLEEIDISKREDVLRFISYYEELYKEKFQFVGSGETNIVFKVGNKIVKFGAMRRYPTIPYCLPIESALQYGKYDYAYVTDRIETGITTQEDAENMYYLLRDMGYVWVDVKASNVGIQNNQLRILDDVDIYTVQDALKTGKSSVLEFLSYNLELALLELEWLSKRVDGFNINQINSYFANQSNTTKELILKLQDEYLKRHASYSSDLNNNDFELFIDILMKKIEEYNFNQDVTR